MFTIISALKGTPQSRARYDDDIIDRLNHRYTQALLIMFAIVTTTNQYVGDNIHCWVPAHFSDPWEGYVNEYCWIKNTYYLPLDEHIPREHESDKRVMIPYYQWVPLILLGQALLFFLPCLLWRTLNDRSGVTINCIVEEGWTFYETETAGERGDRLDRMVKHFHRWAEPRWLSSESNRSKGCTTSCSAILSRILCPTCGKHRGNYLSLLYVLVKVCYLLNAVGQLFLLDAVMGYDFHFYGIEILQKLFLGLPWGESNRFPRVTMCDFLVRFIGNTQRYTVQCVLPINLFNEKIFLFIWFWFVMLIIVNILSVVLWTLRMLFAADHERYIRGHLIQSRYRVLDHDRSGALKSFIRDYLKADGVLVLRMVGHNVDGQSVNEFITALWQRYRGKQDPHEMDEIKPTTHDF